MTTSTPDMLVTKLRSQLRLSEDDDPETRQLLVDKIGPAAAYIDKLAPLAPEVVADEAVVRIAAHLFDGVYSAEYSTPAIARRVGALGLVSPWIVRRAGTF